MRFKTNQLSGGVMLSYFGQALQILCTLFYTPVLLRLLGKSEYGVYQIAFSVISTLSLFTFGFSSSYIKFYSDAKKSEDAERRVAQLNGMFLLVFSGLGLLVLAIGSVLVWQSDAVLGQNLTAYELETGHKLMAIMVINCALNFPTIVYTNHIIAKERFILLQLFNVIGTVLNPCLTFPLLLLGYGSMGMAYALLAITVIKLAASMLYAHLRLRMRFSFRCLNFSAFRNVGVFSLYIFIESLVSTINVSIDRFLIGRMVGSIAAAIYAVGGQINTLYTSLSTSISSVFTPRINRMVTQGGHKKELSDLFTRVGKIQFFVLCPVLCGFGVFGRRFVAIWAGAGYEEAFWVALILILPITIHLIQNTGIEIQRAMGLQKYRSLMYGCMALINLVSTVFLIRLWGIKGAALGTAVAWIGSAVAMNLFYLYRVGLDILGFWRQIGRMILGALPPLGVGLLLMPYIQRCHLVIYFALIAAFVLLYIVSMYLIGLRRDERLTVVRYLKNKVLARSNSAPNVRSEEEHEPFQR